MNKAKLIYLQHYGTVYPILGKHTWQRSGWQIRQKKECLKAALARRIRGSSDLYEAALETTGN